MADLCWVGGVVGAPACEVLKPIIKGGSKAVTETVSFAKDPFGYIASKEQQAAESMSKTLLPAMNDVLHPDFSAAWFLKAYKYSFALACLVMGVLIALQFVQMARGKLAGEEVLQSLIEEVPKFILGAMFGPPVANVFMNLIGKLSDSVVGWGGGGGGIAGSAKSFTKLITSVSPNAMLGGEFVAIILLFLLVLAFVMIAVTLLFMFITLYMSGAVFPLGWVWIVRPENRDKGWKIVKVFGGIMFAQPLVFFMLSIVLSMVSSNMFGQTGGDNAAIKQFVGLIGGTMALLMVVMSPFAANKWAPVGPGESSPSGFKGKGFGKGSRGGAGDSSDSDSQLGQLSRSNGGSGAGGGEASTAGEAGAAGGGEAAAAGGGLAGPLGAAAVMAAQKVKQGFDKLRGDASEAQDDAAKDSTGPDSSEGADQGDSNETAEADNGTDAAGGGVESGDGGGAVQPEAGGADGDQAEVGGDGAAGAGSGLAGAAQDAQAGSEADSAGGSGADGDGGDPDGSGEGSSGLVDLAKDSDGDTGSADGSGGSSPADSDSSDGESGDKKSMWSRLADAAKAAPDSARAGKDAAGSAADRGSSMADFIEEQTTQHMDHQHDKPPRVRR